MARLLAALGCLCLAVFGQQATRAQTKTSEPPTIPVDQFRGLHALIRPQPGELRFHEIPWLIDVWDARKQAAAQGKPILAWSGAGGAPIGVC